MVYVIITIYNAIFIKFQELQKIFSWTKILESGIYLLLVLSQTEQNKWFVWCLSIIIYIYIYTASSVWRALRRETQSNRESMRPLWFFHLYIPSSATTALSTLCQGRLYPHFCIYKYIYIYIYRPTKRCQVTGYVLQRLINIQETRINCFF